MDLQLTFPRGEVVRKCCDCGCSCSSICSTGTWFRSVKRKYDELEGRRILSLSRLGQDSVIRVEAENEILALREMVGSQQKAIQDLLSNLEEERSASSSAAYEAMSMILRLQREKAEAQMEARQFKRMAEERFGHDQLEISAMEDLLYKREQVIQALSCEVHAYKHRMMSYGLTESEADGQNSHKRSTDEICDTGYEFPGYEYPPLKCKTNNNPGPAQGHENDVISGDQLKGLDCDSPTMSNTPEKIIVGHSPEKPKHCRRASGDSLGSFAGLGRDCRYDLPTESPRLGNSDHISHTESPSKLKEGQEDDASDRIYTIETVHVGVQPSRESFYQPDIVDPDIKKLYARLQALEADRESMRHAIISMQTDKAKLLLLKEIAQRLCKDPLPERHLPPKKPPTSRRFSVVSVFKWIGSILWRRRALPCKYNFGLSPPHVGLLLLLENQTHSKELRRLLTKVQARA